MSGFAGYALAAGWPLELVPELDLSYDRLTRSRVAERCGLADQAFATGGLHSVRLLVGGRVASLEREEMAGLRFKGRAYWAYELADTVAVVRSDLFGAPFATRTSARDRDGAVLAASLTGTGAEGVSLGLNYTGDVRSGAKAQLFSAGLPAPVFHVKHERLPSSDPPSRMGVERHRTAPGRLARSTMPADSRRISATLPRQRPALTVP